MCHVDEAVLMEVQSSLRLFGGARALCERVMREAVELGASQVGRGPTALAALAFARTVPGTRPTRGPAAHSWAERLDTLPLGALTAAALHEPLLARLGCRTLGQLRALPRTGLARRCGAALLEALDQAYGVRPERWDWLRLPEVFDTRLELPGRVEEAGALMFGARRLVLQMCGWLAARHAGVRHFVLGWRHDFHRPGTDDAGELVVRTAEITRQPEHLCRLLGELLSRVQLDGPVGELSLRADTVEPLAPHSAALALEAGAAAPRDGESLAQLVERLTARLGAERVVRPQLVSDHRPESMQHWRAAATGEAPRPLPAGALPSPLPGWLLCCPEPLAVRRDLPQHGGALQLLAGPHRVDAGWWEVEAGPGAVARDYYIAADQRGSLLWIYRERVSAAADAGAAGWFLHGVFG
ncbi:hypothetical protein AAW51_1147 [Caldimonas brevitalea]|uniref:Protein ImuB n=1 Tax=Caldimonas brevitalea TaxID=413882 RepID=A0A0G3BIP1_9BURK|nr:hypothetical protein AAW51_1147 [Caldimonas brevitalea]